MRSVQTVCGKINVNDPGISLPHEHCLIDQSCWWKGEHKEPSKRNLFNQAVSLQNRREVIYNCFNFLDNLIFTDIEDSI
jgi:predicted metal-dependent phosphotriesterase family hydrolase